MIGKSDKSYQYCCDTLIQLTVYRVCYCSTTLLYYLQVTSYKQITILKFKIEKLLKELLAYF